MRRAFAISRAPLKAASTRGVKECGVAGACRDNCIRCELGTCTRVVEIWKSELSLVNLAGGFLPLKFRTNPLCG